MFNARNTRRQNRCGRLWGAVLMTAGLVLMMIIVPWWAWAGIICACVIAVGFAIWYGGLCR